MARHHDIWVITHAKHRASIEKHLRTNPNPRLQFVYHTVQFISEKTRAKIPLTFGVQFEYYLWQLTSHKVAREWNEKIGFDVAHHTVWSRYWTPSGLAGLGIPLVWGPVGAAEIMPSDFARNLPLKWRFSEGCRGIAQQLARFDPILKRTARSATITLVTTEATAKAVKTLGACTVRQMPTVTFTPDELRHFATFSPAAGSGFKAICVGRLVHWKGYHLAIQAFASFKRMHPDSELWIVNDGPERSRLEALAARLNVRDSVSFLGKLPTLADVHSRMAQCDVLVHPALHESFGNVCLEAMALSKPVICLDLGGPATQVTKETGYCIPATSEKQAVQGIDDALAELYADRRLGPRLGAAGRRRVADRYSSVAMVDVLQSYYDEAASEMQPDFASPVVQ